MLHNHLIGKISCNNLSCLKSDKNITYRSSLSTTYVYIAIRFRMCAQCLAIATTIYSLKYQYE